DRELITKCPLVWPWRCVRARQAHEGSNVPSGDRRDHSSLLRQARFASGAARLSRSPDLTQTPQKRDQPSMTYRHATAPTQFVEANGIRFAYRRFGPDSGTPLLFMQHFRGGMDHWDPTVTDGFAKNRPVILFDNAGVAASS